MGVRPSQGIAADTSQHPLNTVWLLLADVLLQMYISHINAVQLHTEQQQYTVSQKKRANIVTSRLIALYKYSY